MSTFAEAAAALRKAAVELPRDMKAGVVEATAFLGSAVTVSQARAGAGSGRLRGVGPSGAAIGVRATVRGGTGLVRAIGPAHLLDHPTRAHVVAPRRKAAMVIPGLDHPVSGPIVRPATKGKPYFEEAVEAAGPRVVALIEQRVITNLLDRLA